MEITRCCRSLFGPRGGGGGDGTGGREKGGGLDVDGMCRIACAREKWDDIYYTRGYFDGTTTWFRDGQQQGEGKTGRQTEAEVARVNVFWPILKTLKLIWYEGGQGGGRGVTLKMDDWNSDAAAAIKIYGLRRFLSKKIKDKVLWFLLLVRKGTRNESVFLLCFI